MPRKSSAKPARRTWRRDREGKEQDLIRAFATVLTRDGVQAVGVNAILKEAGVGKNLLYKYFGGLRGLAQAWAKSSDFLPDESEVAGADTESYARMSTADQISHNFRAYTAAIRRRPLTLEILAQELLRPTELSEGFDEVRSQFGRRLQRYFTRPDEYQREGTVALMVVLYAAVTYLALRARSQPRYFWLRLDAPEDWRRIEAMIDLIVHRVVQAEPAAGPDAAAPIVPPPGTPAKRTTRTRKRRSPAGEP